MYSESSKKFVEMIKEVDQEHYTEFVKSEKETLNTLLKAKKECSSFFRQMINKGYFLCRGTQNKSDIYLRTPRKTKRKPLDNSEFVDEWLESYRKKYFPMVPSRQKSVFTTMVKPETTNSRGLRIAKTYGSQIVYVLPKNGFKIFQSGVADDFEGSDVQEAVYPIQGLERLMKYMKGNDNDEYKAIVEEMERAKKEAEKEADIYYTSGYIEFKGMKEEWGEIYLEHKGYYAINRRFVKEYKAVSGINSEMDLFTTKELNRIQKTLKSK